MENSVNQLVVVQIAEASNLVTSGDYRGAERALQEIASQQGDKVLILSLKQVPAKDLTLILVSTATSPSAICGELVTPDLFVKSLCHLPLTWKMTDEKSAFYDLQEMLLGIVMRLDANTGEPRDAVKFLKAILKNHHATQMLAYCLHPERQDSPSIQEKHTETDEEEKISESDNVSSMKKYEFVYNTGELNHLLVLVRKVPLLFERMQIMWKDGLSFEDLFSGVTKKSQAKSAL